MQKNLSKKNFLLNNSRTSFIFKNFELHPLYMIIYLKIKEIYIIWYSTHKFQKYLSKVFCFPTKTAIIVCASILPLSKRLNLINVKFKTYLNKLLIFPRNSCNYRLLPKSWSIKITHFTIITKYKILHNI